MKVPFPYSHPKYDPSKIRPSRESPIFSPFSSNRLPTFSSSQESRADELRAKLSDYDYRYSAAFSEYEKCLLTPLTSNYLHELDSCNLTQFIEIEKQKLINKNKFYQELSGNNVDSILKNQPVHQIQSPSLSILFVAGLFGLFIVFLVPFYLLYLYYNNIKKKSSLETLQSQADLTSSPELVIFQPQSNLKHHNLEIFREHEIGRGSNGTVVYRGLFEGRRHVAVKKMVSKFHHFERYFYSHMIIFFFG